jgi:hypothetical protein
MSNMNSAVRKKKRKILLKRDGPYCNDCGKRGGFRRTKKQPKLLLLLIDHIDNDNDNNDDDNLQFLCRSCNTLKNPRTKYAKAQKAPRDPGEMPFVMRKSRAIDKKAKEWMQSTVTDDVRLLKQEVVQRLAFVTDSSIITLERWIQKAVVNEEPACQYCTFMDDDENVWIELKPEYRKATQ